MPRGKIGFSAYRQAAFGYFTASMQSLLPSIEPARSDYREQTSSMGQTE